MRPRLLLALAASSLSVGAFTAPASLAAMADDGTARAADFMAKAERELARDRTERAVRYAEEAVEAAPLNAEARQLMARAYLSDGRLSSAEAAYRDLLTLVPGDAGATLNLALVRAALGDRTEARSLLMAAENLSPADRGLGLVLAGDVAGGGAMLEAAARSPDADGRVRQNLAFAYAVGGDWRRARTVASQDLAPAAVHQRIGEWARVARPRNSWDQVAYLLNITPVEDGGMPARLALRMPMRDAAPVAVAVAEPSVELAAYAEPDGAGSGPAIAPPLDAAPSVVAVPVVQPIPVAPVRTAAAVAETPRLIPATATVRAASSRFVPDGRFVVQLGAYVTPGAAERGWAKAMGRVDLADATPLASKATVGGRQFTRLAAGHFASRAQAAALCRAVQSRGGRCFVREAKGDDTPRWASRVGAKMAAK